MNQIWIQTTCTPRYAIGLDIDPNPNGYPVLWMSINTTNNNKRIIDVPMSKTDVRNLIEELQKRIGDLNG